MLYRNEIVQQDLAELVADKKLPLIKLKNKSVLITGATGMLARYATYLLLYLNSVHNYDIKIYLLARSAEKAKASYGEFLHDKNVRLLCQDICVTLELADSVDYIIHAAGSCSAYAIKHNPIGIIEANTMGVKNILDYARRHDVANILYISTREIYGKMSSDSRFIKETDMGTLDPSDSRSCYPESKRLGEQLFRAYGDMYGIRYSTIRMAHAYGPGMTLENDGRVMADFMADAVKGRDIVLKSTGEAVRAFCYLKDAVAAIYLTLLQGANGEAYNVANEDEPMMIRDVAKLLTTIAANGTTVSYREEVDQSGYCKYPRVALATDKIRQLGWKPTINLREGLKRTYISFK